MFKPLPADPALIQKLRVRNRVASLVSVGLLVAWPVVASMAVSQFLDTFAQYAWLVAPVQGLFSVLLIPASVFFFGHAMRYRNLLRYLSMNPPVYAATEPAPTDLSKLRSKKVMAIVWHAITLGVPVLWLAAGFASSGDKGAMLNFIILGSFLTMFALTGGLALSVASINGYLSLKAKLRWAYPDSQAWRPASTSKTS